MFRSKGVSKKFFMLDKILNSIEKQSISVGQWFMAFLGIVFIRFLLESLSNHSTSYVLTDFLIAQDFSTMVHLIIFFLASAVGLIFIIYSLTKYPHTYKIILYGLIMIWFAPLFDLISTHGSGVVMSYIPENNLRLLSEFFSFFSPHITQGITLGIRVEVLLILIGIGFVVWRIKKNIKLSLIATLISFIFIFILLSLPGVTYTITHPSLVNSSQELTNDFLVRAISESNIKFNTIHGNLIAENTFVQYELGFDKLMSQLLFLVFIIFVILYFFRSNKEKFLIIIKNSRLVRTLFFSSFIFLGIFIAYKFNLGQLTSWVDFMSILILFVSWYGAWMFAVHTNDITDIKSDLISNPNRPIVSKNISVDEMRQIGLIWLIISLFGSFSVGYCQFFLNLIFIFAYYIYSAEPLRLKRVPILSSFLIGVACLVTFLSGFFFLSEDKITTIFPVTISLGIIIMFTLGANIRDLKDVAGDKEDGVFTIPILFGKWGKQVVGFMLALAFLLMPVFLSYHLLYIFAIPASVIGYFLVVKKEYEEKYIFLLYFVFILLYAGTFLI